MGFTPQRSLPTLSKITLKQWYRKRSIGNNHSRKVYLLADEFSSYNDSHIGIKAIELLECLGYQVLIPPIFESGRTYISKGFLKTARRIATRNIGILKEIISDETPLIGIEPSAILGFRDEYPDLVDGDKRAEALELGKHCLMFDEFFMREVDAGRITRENFVQDKRVIKLHGHCQQKAVASTKSTLDMLSFPSGHSVTEIPSGCCGMAGAFGYEKTHYDLSMKVGELVLFPEIRKSDKEILIAAPGTSCRQQIIDGTGRKGLHPIELMWEALKKR